jgi:hypothetical protein
VCATAIAEQSKVGQANRNDELYTARYVALRRVQRGVSTLRPENRPYTFLAFAFAFALAAMSARLDRLRTTCGNAGLQ